MPVVPRFNGHSIVYVVEPATVETRADAVGAEVRRADVDRALVEDVERTVRMASRTLGLDPAPRLRWLTADTKNIRGVVFDESLDEVWVRIQDPERTRNSALHELRHIHQLRDQKYVSLGLTTYEARQRDADNFAETWTWEMTPPVVDQAAAHREWERVWLPVHEATARHYAERAEAHRFGGAYRHRGGPMLRANLDSPTKRRTYEVKGVTYVVCSQCDEGVALYATHRCPAARRQASAAGYDVKVVR